MDIAPSAQRVRLLCLLSPTGPYMVVTVRLAGFRLIEAGIDQKPSIDCV